MEKALSQVGFNAPVVDNDKCIRCGKCCKTCPMKALVLKDVES
jgi:Fe-S-cluster-containing hydrogenase component 2